MSAAKVTKSTKATAKQINLMIALGSQLFGKKLWSVYALRKTLNLTNREARGNMSITEASQHIDSLKRLLGQAVRLPINPYDEN